MGKFLKENICQRKWPWREKNIARLQKAALSTYRVTRLSFPPKNPKWSIGKKLQSSRVGPPNFYENLELCQIFTSSIVTINWDSLVTPKLGLLLRIQSFWAKHSEFTPKFGALRSQSCGHRMLVTQFWSKYFGYKISVTKFWSHNYGHTILVAKVRSHKLGDKILVNKFWSQKFGHTILSNLI